MKPVYENDEVPPLKGAVARAEGNIKRSTGTALRASGTEEKAWFDKEQGVRPCSVMPNDATSFGCPHIWSILPHRLSLQVFKSGTDARSLRLGNPVHALHLQSQLTNNYTIDSGVEDDRYYYQHGLLYGEEQERSLVVTAEGLMEQWHPLLRPPPHKLSRKEETIKTMVPMVLSSQQDSSSLHKTEALAVMKATKESNDDSSIDPVSLAHAGVSCENDQRMPHGRTTMAVQPIARHKEVENALLRMNDPEASHQAGTDVGFIHKEVITPVEDASSEPPTQMTTFWPEYKELCRTETTKEKGIGTVETTKPPDPKENSSLATTSDSSASATVDKFSESKKESRLVLYSMLPSHSIQRAAEKTQDSEKPSLNLKHAEKFSTQATKQKLQAESEASDPADIVASKSGPSKMSIESVQAGASLRSSPVEVVTTSDVIQRLGSSTCRSEAHAEIEEQTMNEGEAKSEQRRPESPATLQRPENNRASSSVTGDLQMGGQGGAPELQIHSPSPLVPPFTATTVALAKRDAFAADAILIESPSSPPVTMCSPDEKFLKLNEALPPPSAVADPSPLLSSLVPIALQDLVGNGLELGPGMTAESASALSGAQHASTEPKAEFWLEEYQFRRFQAQEDQVRTLRRSFLSKRNAPVMPNRKSKLTTGSNSGAAYVNHTKKRRTEHRTAHLIHSRALPVMPTDDEASYMKRMKEASKRVEHWMDHFRLARKNFWRGRRDHLVFSRIKHTFGSVPHERANRNVTVEFPDSEDCSKSKQTLMQCLDCHFVGFLPLAKDVANSHILEHMALSGHGFAVTLEASAQIYCFCCESFVGHEVFDKELLRLDLQEKMPFLAWKEQSIKRSFDAMRFINLPESGITWDGIVASYPASVPDYHIQASRKCHERLFSFAGETEFLRDITCTPVKEFAAMQGRFELSRQFKISKPVGIYNLGDTCFQSAVFQCLLNCAPLQRFFLRVGHNYLACPLYPKETVKAKHDKARESTKICLGCEFDKILLSYYGSSIGFRVKDALSTSPRESEPLRSDTVLFQQPGEPIIASDMLAATWKCADLSHLAGYGQNDAHEFLHGFLDVLQKHIKKYQSAVSKTVLESGGRKLQSPTEKHTNLNDDCDIIQGFFEGKLRSVLLCTTCGEKRNQNESFLSISLPLSKDVHRTTEGRPGESTDGPGRLFKSKLSIERQLRHFTLPESLSDPVDCPACGKKTPTIKQHVVSKLPRILCLHLKRFDDKKKINDFVSFPLRSLNMGSLLPQFCEVTRFGDQDQNVPTADAELLYDLFGTVNHFGTLQSGHYVANVKVDNHWYHCNDAHVSQISEDDVLKSDAYLLFYKRR